MTATLEPSAHERLEHIWSDRPGLVGFFTSVDHKRVGIRYLVTGMTFLLLGGIESLFLRTQLAVPESGVLSPQVYNDLFTMHGTTMIFLFNTTIWAGFGNYFLPLQIGTRDMAFPRLNMLSYWIFLFSGIFFYSSFLIAEVPDAGWFAYPPFSGNEFNPSLGVDFWAVGMAFLGVSSTVGAINFLVTVFKLRAPGMSASRIPIFVWGIVAMAFMMVFSLPAVTLAQVLLELDRLVGFRFFVATAGGDPVLYQHLFWFWGHPEVYIVFVPATGFISMLVASLSRTRLAARLLVVTALIAIAFISFGVWVHHMFVVGLGFMALSFFSAASFIVSIPSGVQFFAWIATLWKGRPVFRTPMLFAVGMMLIFLLGGLTGVMVAMIPIDFQVHDTYFVVAHFHYTLVGGSVFPVFAALYWWLPKITGRMTSELWGKVSFWLMFLGFNLTFFPMHLLGMWGMPRRYYTYQAGFGWDSMNLLATIGAYVAFLGALVSLGNFIWARFRGPAAGPNPWGADTLEWATSSPPADYNFLETPRISSAYPLWDQPELQVAGAEEDAQLGRPVLLPPPGVEEHYLLATSGVDAEPDQVVPMPSPTSMPLFVALGGAIASYGVLIREFWFGMAGAALITAALLRWHWPQWEPEPVELAREETEEAIR